MRQPAYGQNTQPTEIGRESASLPINSPSQIPDAATLFHASSVSVRNEFCDLKVEFNAADEIPRPSAGAWLLFWGVVE
jgi:hypothetical protein